jgi:hypothetical protein
MLAMQDQWNRPLTGHIISAWRKFMVNVDRNQFERIIRSCHGHTYRTAGMLFGFFEDPKAAKAAASLIAATGVSVMTCGSQIMIVV